MKMVKTKVGKTRKVERKRRVERTSKVGKQVGKGTCLGTRTFRYWRRILEGVAEEQAAGT